jgi:hypothetical protein
MFDERELEEIREALEKWEETTLRSTAGYRLAAKPLAIILLPCYSFSGFWKLVSSIRFGQD